MGINLAGGEFGSKVPGTYGKDYIYPSHSDIDYYASKGMEAFRLPFLWERIQHSKFGALDSAEVGRIQHVVDYANSKGIKVILDMHNYGSGFGHAIGSSETPNKAFADVWGKLANQFSDDNVMYGLMNEPHNQNATQWIASANSAIDAIRHAGAHQRILVPGAYWDNASSWVSSDNDRVVGGGVRDPGNNYAFEVHQYLDANGSGTGKDVVSENIGVERIQAITKWAEDTGHDLFLGEVGVGRDQKSLTALDKMLDYMEQHQDAWDGASYWAGGPWWGDYMYSADPQAGVDKPQMAVLGQHG